MLFQLFTAGGDFREALIYLLLFIPIFLISFSVHEAAHAFMAWKLGDPTARNLGRLTLNPAKHLDPIGTVSMLLIGIGYGKPVPINSRYFKKPKRDMAISSFAGPASNFLLAVIGMLGYNLTNLLFNHLLGGLPIQALGVWPFREFAQSEVSSPGLIFCMILMTFFYYFSWMNISLAVFNLIPIPPFDGSRIAFAVLPDRYYWGIMRYEKYILIGLLVGIFALNRILPVSPVSLVANWILNGVYAVTKWIAVL